MLSAPCWEAKATLTVSSQSQDKTFSHAVIRLGLLASGISLDEFAEMQNDAEAVLGGSDPDNCSYKDGNSTLFCNMIPLETYT